MSANVTRLYGDGRHPVGIRFTYEGKQYHLRFVGPDREVEVDGIGREVPIRMAEHLRDMSGSGIYFRGGEPADAGVFEAEQKRKAEENADKPKRGEGQTNAQVTAPAGKQWPTMDMSKDELTKACLSAGIKQAALRGLNKADLYDRAVEALTKQFPAWAEAEAKKGG